MRSQLFVPGDSERKLAKGADSGADCLILDLEDSLTPETRPKGRELIREYLQQHTARKPLLYVRVNALGSPDILQDLAAVLPGAPDGIVLPKCASGDDVRMLDHYLSALEAREGLEVGSTRILPIATEQAAAMLAMDSYRDCSPRLIGLMWGAEDLAADLGAATNRRADGAYDDVFRLARTMTLLGAVAAGVLPIDTVYTDYKDEQGLEAECLAARRAGFLGKPAIHPAQLDIINRAFSVTPEEMEWARRVVQAFADKPSAGVVGLDGVMLDQPHLKQANTILARGGDILKS